MCLYKEVKWECFWICQELHDTPLLNDMILWFDLHITISSPSYCYSYGNYKEIEWDFFQICRALHKIS